MRIDRRWIARGAMVALVLTVKTLGQQSPWDTTTPQCSRTASGASTTANGRSRSSSLWTGERQPGGAPADATVLVGARDDLSAWQMMDGSSATWSMKSGVLETGKGFLRTKAEFTDVQLHVEFATPSEIKGDSQGRGNSGVFLLGKFEIQVLDSYHNPTYPDGQASAMYGQYPPLVNASRPPGE